MIPPARRAGKTPKRYRYRLHRLKNLYRKVYHCESEIELPVQEETARRAIVFLEAEILRAGVVLPEQDVQGQNRVG